MNAILPVESAEIALIPTALVPAQVYAPGGIEAILDQLERDVRKQAEALDASTPKGRAALKKLSNKVASSKVALDNMGKDLTEAIRLQKDGVDADRRSVRQRLDALRDEVKQPVEAYEQIERDRVADHQAALRQVEQCVGLPVDQPAWTMEVTEQRLAELAAIMKRNWQEFEMPAVRAHAAVVLGLTDIRKRLIREAEERAEQERLAAEEAERARARAEKERQEREARIAAEAAEKARLDAEAKAERERQETLRAAAEERARVEREAQKRAYARSLIQHITDCGMGFIGGQPQPYGILLRELDEKVSLTVEDFGDLLDEAREEARVARGRLEAGMEAQRKRVAAEAEAKLAAEAAEAERRKVEQKREAAERRALEARQQAEAAERRRREDAEESVRARDRALADAAERARIEREAAIKAERDKRAEEDARAKREAEAARVEAERKASNKAHRAQVNVAARDALVALGLDETLATQVITAIALGKIPAVSIGYGA